MNNICMRLIVNSDTDEIGAKEIYSVLNQEEWTDGAPAGEQAPGEVNLEDRGEVNNAGAKMAAAAHLREPEETARIREALEPPENGQSSWHEPFDALAENEKVSFYLI